MAMRLAGAALLCTTAFAAGAPRLHYNEAARRYSVDGRVALKDVRLGIELNGQMRWAGAARC